jgi:hypothetical protein
MQETILKINVTFLWLVLFDFTQGNYFSKNGLNRLNNEQQCCLSEITESIRGMGTNYIWISETLAGEKA